MRKEPKYMKEILLYCFGKMIGEFVGRDLNYFRMNNSEKKKLEKFSRNFVWPE